VVGLGAALTAIVRAISGSSLKSAAVLVAMFLALKVVMTTLVVTGMAVVLNNFVIDFITEYIAEMAVSLSQGTGFESSVISLTGVGGYLGRLMLLKQSLALVISGLCIGATRKFIPIL